MSVDERTSIYRLLKDGNGFVTATQVTAAGIPRRCLTAMSRSGLICKVERGIYALPEVWEDDLFFTQYRFSKGIFSHETALSLHSLTDRTPVKYTMTFPAGYNTVNARRKGIIAKCATADTYALGVTEVPSPNGNPLRVYDIERTLCDIVKTRHKADIQVINQAMKAYASSRDKDMAKLIDYARRLRVTSKVLHYIEVLL